MPRPRVRNSHKHGPGANNFQHERPFNHLVENKAPGDAVEEKHAAQTPCWHPVGDSVLRVRVVPRSNSFGAVVLGARTPGLHMDRILRAVLTKEGQSVSEKAAVVRGICGSVAASGPAGVQAVGAALIQLAVGGSGEVPVEVAGPCLRAAAAACSGVTTHWLSHPPVVDMLTCMVREGVDVTADPRGHVALAVVVGVLRRLCGDSGEAGARWAQLDGPLGAFVETALPALVPAAVTLPVIEDVVCMLGCGEGMAAFHRLPVAAQANALVQWLGIVPYCSATAAPGPVPGAGTQAQLRASLVTLLQLMWCVAALRLVLDTAALVRSCLASTLLSVTVSINSIACGLMQERRHAGNVPGHSRSPVPPACRLWRGCGGCAWARCGGPWDVAWPV